MSIFLIANPKGGVGKSTLAVNLAAWFANEGWRVALGDIDRQQSARAWLQLRPPTLPFIHHWRLDSDDFKMPATPCDHCIIDSPAGMHGKKLAAMLRCVDAVIIPLQPSLFDILATRDFFDELLAAKQVRKERVRIGLVGMRVDERTRAAGELERFLAGVGLPVIAWLRDTQNYVQAAAHGLSVFDLAPSRAARDQQQWAPLLQWAGGGDAQ